MAQSISKLSRSSSYKDHTYEAHQRLIDHKTYMARFVRLVSLEPVIADKYRGDLYGLLDELNIDFKYHYPIMIINDLSSPADYDGVPFLLVFDNDNDIDRILNS